ncbi:MAG TPA: protein kinase [Terriglobia bacterium]|nr:protein kinase [Terriglobia bacterium]
MPLTLGTKLGPYEIVAPLGAGGMGEVYRARDTKLNRDVALKVLPEAFSADSQRMARFEREAQVLASLNHPNIATIHGLEESGTTRALVMELVEGPTLAERISVAAVSDRRPGTGAQRAPLQLDEALEIARQIAEALEFAHERGIIHRDLKPANVKITPDGLVKVLDFGLAKALDPEDSGSNLPNSPTLSPTLSIAATQAGVILGTAAYMSPEQARGKKVDRRADIWAFGAVLYEMLGGKQPFSGGTISDTLAEVLKFEPDWNALPPGTPASIQKLLRRCLAKDPKRRLRDIGEARITIEETLSGSDVGPGLAPALMDGSTRPPQVAALRRALPWAVAGVFLIAAIISTAAYLRLARVPVRAIISEIPPPPGTGFAFNPTNGAIPELSPDGTRMAFVASGKDGKQLLWVRPLDSTEAHPLHGTEGTMTPFWSPDSRYLGFFANGKLRKIEVSGGATVDLCDAPWGRGGAWAPDGTILFAPNIDSTIYRISAGGGSPTAVTRFDQSRGETSHRWPQFLPDGRHFIFYANSSTENDGGAYVASLEGGEAKLVLKGSSNAVYAAGDLLFVQGGNLMAQLFDMSHFQVVGDPSALADSVGVLQIARRALLTASSNGILGYWTNGASVGVGQPLWFDRKGKQVGSISSPGFVTASPHLSPDGTKLAAQRARVGGWDIWTIDLGRGAETRLTFNPAVNTSPVWSPDGARIAFASNRSGLFQIYEKPANGTGATTRLLQDDANDTPSSWSADGKYLAYHRLNQQGKSASDIWVLPSFGDKKPFLFLTSQFNKRDPAFSPNGKWLAYSSDETGRDEVYIAPFPKANGKWEASTNGGTLPRWRRDGEELFYIAPNQMLMSVDVQRKGDSIEISSPHALLQIYPPLITSIPYDVSIDGKKFIVVTQTAETSTVPVTLVVNWPARLKKQ